MPLSQGQESVDILVNTQAAGLVSARWLLLIPCLHQEPKELDLATCLIESTHKACFVRDLWLEQ